MTNSGSRDGGTSEPITRTIDQLLMLASRFTVDRNDVEPDDRARYRSDLVLHVERERRTGHWYVQQIGSDGAVYNVATGEFDTDWTFRHAEGRVSYLLDRDEALDLAHALPREVLTGHDTTWRWQRRA